MIDKYIKFIKNNKSQIDKSVPQIIISGLPIVNEQTTYCKANDKYKGASEKSKELNSLYEKYCKENNIIYINNNDLQTGIDGVHLTLESHRLLADRLSKILINM